MNPADSLKVEGQNLSFRSFGSGTRKILFFHGFPGSSAQVIPFQLHTSPLDFEVVCIDRPGYNQTQVSSERQFDQVTRLSRALLRLLGWTSCEAMSVSGGTPFLFSFVRTHPEFVSKVTIVSGLCPLVTDDFSRLISFKAKTILRMLPMIPAAVLKRILPQSKDTEEQRRSQLIQYFLPSSPADQKALLSSAVRKMLSQAIREAFMQNGIGPQRDAKEYLTPWSIDLKDYKGPIDIWHGQEDLVIPPATAIQMNKLLATSRLHMVEGEGHYSLAIKLIERILTEA